MVQARSILLSAIITPLFLFAQSLEITSFFTPENRCDYLIITPRIFSEGALRLATYRNGFGGDDVTSARYVVFERLGGQFSRPLCRPDTMLKESISWALKNWALPPSYIVLIGDDSIRVAAGDSAYFNRGPMPVHICGENCYSDDWYLKTCVSDWMNGFCDSYDFHCKDQTTAIGRIPCEHMADFDLYLQKVQRYESLRPAPWRNRVLFVTDDSLNGGKLDGNHSVATFESMRLLSGRFVTTLFFNDFARNTAAAKDSFFNYVNGGTGWIVYYGHGSPGGLTAEGLLLTGDYTRFRNADMPVVFFSHGCANGAFYLPSTVSMCKRFLFTDEGGAIAYIANPNNTLVRENDLMNGIIRFHDSLPGLSIGKLFALAKRGECFGSNYSYEIFGDPAVRDGVREVPLGMQLLSNGTLECSTPAGSMDPGTLCWEITSGREWRDSLLSWQRRDSVVASGRATLLDGSYRIMMPPLPKSNLLRIIAYAWNDSLESRGDMKLYNGAPPSLPPPMLCSFTAHTSDDINKAVALGDSLVLGVGWTNDLILLKRQLSGLTPASPPAIASDYRIIDALSASPDGHLMVAMAGFHRLDSGLVRRVALRNVDPSGKQRWSFCDSAIDSMCGIESCSDGGCIAWGFMGKAIGTCLVRLDAIGNPVWRKTTGATVEDVVATPSGQCMFAGSIMASSDSLSNRPALYFGKRGPTGELAWEKTFLKKSPGSGNALCLLPSGRWIVAGTIADRKSSTLWIFCVDADGDTIWSRTIDNAAASSCLAAEEGCVAIGGSLDTNGIVVLFDQGGTGRYTMNVPGGGIRLLAPEKKPYGFLAAFKNGGGESIGVLSGIGTSIHRYDAHTMTKRFQRFSAVVLPSRNILFTLAEPEKTSIDVDLFDVRGRRIRTVVIPSGCRRFFLDHGNCAPGTYIGRLHTTKNVFGIALLHLQ